MWAKVSYAGGVNTNWYSITGNWPLNFPNTCLDIFNPSASDYFGTNWMQMSISGVSCTTNGFSFRVMATNSSAYVTNAQTFTVLAVGY
jgi:hypothetical protein